MPKDMKLYYDGITALTDEYCKKFLSLEYLECARNITSKLCSIPSSPLLSGQYVIWACGIIYAASMVFNVSGAFFSAVDLCSTFNVSVHTASAKAAEICEAIRYAYEFKS
jgi:hypothetical protein